MKNNLDYAKKTFCSEQSKQAIIDLLSLNKIEFKIIIHSVLTAINWLEAKLLIGGTPKLKAFVITYKRLFKTSKELFDEKLSFNSDRKVYFCNLNLYNKCHVICAAK